MDLKKITPYIVGILLAVGAYFTGASVNDSVQIALDTDKAKAACVELLEGRTATVPADTLDAPAE